MNFPSKAMMIILCSQQWKPIKYNLVDEIGSNVQIVCNITVGTHHQPLVQNTILLPDNPSYSYRASQV